MNNLNVPRRHDSAVLWRWRTRLLPFMRVALMVLGAIFVIGSLWQYGWLQLSLDPPKVELRQEIKHLETIAGVAPTQEYRDWYVRALLEEAVLKRRYQQQSIAVQSRVWTRLMGLLTGMVMVFSGCFFVLGKLRETATTPADALGAKPAPTPRTSSPGIILALTGSALIALVICLPVTVELSDSAVYLPPHAAMPAATAEGPGQQASGSAEASAGTRPAGRGVPAATAR